MNSIAIGRAFRVWLSVTGITATSILATIAHGQTAVTGITYGAWSGGNATYDSSTGLTFLNYNRAVESVQTAGGSYQFNGPIAQNIYFRRDNGNGDNNSSLFYQTTTTNNSTKVLGQDVSTLEQAFLTSNLLEGLRNPFANGSGVTNGNIERIDFYLPNYTVTGTERLVFFDLENAGNFGDGFRIAAFTDWSTKNLKPTTYANTGTLIQPGTYGPALSSPTAGTNGDFIRASYTNGDNLTGSANVASLQSDLNLVGIMISFADLGISAGTTIQGFSLMAGDVSVTKASQLVDWTNSNYYKNNTDAATWGNVDFMAFGARLANPVPEPATFGILMIGTFCTLLGGRRRLRRA